MLELKNVSKTYTTKKGVNVKALDDVSIKFEETGMVFILGKSGSGKSTMLNLLGGLDKYDEGEILIKGKSSKAFTQSEFDSYRNTYVGFIFQEYNILPEFTVGANIALAMELQGKKADNESLNKLLDEVDLTGHANRKPNELSGGQKQRVAIARALIKEPEIIMADEPTGALDSKTGKQVFETLQKLSKTRLVIIVSHDREFAEYYGDRVIEMSDGKIISDIIKHKVSAENKSEGVSIVDNSIMHIKKGYELSVSDLKFINEFLQKSEDDTIISTDKASNIDFKKLARIDDEGNRDAFKPTDDENLPIKDYAESEFKLIKSKLPIKNAFKIGASSLKVKPVRLFFTILLAAIAFAMFGLADTLGSYDKIASTVSSIMDNKVKYVSMVKQKPISTYNGYYFIDTTLNDSDIDKLNKDLEGLNFIPVISTSSGKGGSQYNISNFKNESDFPTQYQISYFNKAINGFATASAEEIDLLGYKLLGNSKMPSTDTEILITKYTYSHYEFAGWRNPDDMTVSADIKNVNDLIGKKILTRGFRGDKSFTVSGVVDTEFDEARYAKFKDTSNGSMQNDVSSMLLMMELNTVLVSGPHSIGFVTEKFIEKNIDMSYVNSYLQYSGDYSVNADWFDENGQEIGFSMDTFGNIKNANTDIVYLNGKNMDNMGANDTVVDLFTAINLYNVANSITKIDYMELYKDEAYKFALDTLAATPELFDDFAKFINVENVSQNYLRIAEEYAYFMSFKLNEPSSSTDTYPKADFHTKALQNVSNILSGAKIAPVNLYANQYYKDDDNSKKHEMNVVGFKIPKTFSHTQRNTQLYINDKAVELLGINFEIVNPYGFALAKMPTSRAEILKIVKYANGDSKTNKEFFSLKNSVTEIVNNVNELIVTLADVFKYVGLGFAIFASLLMMNFITTSVSYKKREIGILRAVGARSSDVFGIFFSESFIIACINGAVAIVLSIIGIGALNGVIRNNFGLPLTVLNFGFRQILLIFAVSVGVSFISSLLPVTKIARKKPIDSINNK